MSSKFMRNNIGARIKSVRLNTGLTQQAFSSSLGIAQGYLSELEKGMKNPSDTLLIALSSLYEINMDWLISGKGKLCNPPVKQSLNLSLIKIIIEAVEAVLDKEGEKLSPGKKSSLVIRLYETLIKEGADLKGAERKKFLRERVSKFIRMAT